MRHGKSGPVAVLPEHDPSHSPPANIGGVVLGSDKAIFHSLVSRGAQAVTVGSPGEDLDPADDVVWMVGIVTSGQADRVTSRVGYGDSLHSHVEWVCRE